jgi:hypothetical protein
MVKSPKVLAKEAIIGSLALEEVDVTPALDALIQDLIDAQWLARNRSRMIGRDEGQILKLITDYVSRLPEKEINE